METVFLQRTSPDTPWGFRLYGGCDYSQPLTVQKVTEGSVAWDKVGAGDVILQIGSNETSSMTHAQAMGAIKSSGTTLQLGILRGYGQVPESPIISPQFDRQLSLHDPPHTNGNWSHHQQSTNEAPNFTQPEPKVPDAVLNMAARGDSSKKPFSYVADIHDIQMQREKVKNRSPNQKVIPSYQNMLNMPQFDDPRSRGSNKFNTPLSPTSPPVGQPGGDAVVSNLQFNSPLKMYSNDNVIESLKGQTGAEIKDVVGLQKKDQSDITQSPVYKMIHGIDQPKARPVISYAENRPAELERPQQDDGDEYPQKSIRYTGNAIPSRSFKILQNMTSGDNHPSSAALKFPPPHQQQQQQQQHQQQHQQQRNNNRPHHHKQPTGNFRPPPEYQPAPYRSSPSFYPNTPYGGPRRGSMERREGSSEVDTSSIYQHLRGSDDYNEKSVRYVGKSIPSKCFKMLQDMTGGPRDNDGLPGPKRHHVTSQSDVEEEARKYSGNNIPSQSFKMLQRFVGDEQQSGSQFASKPHVVQQTSVEDATDF